MTSRFRPAFSREKVCLFETSLPLQPRTGSHLDPEAQLVPQNHVWLIVFIDNLENVAGEEVPSTPCRCLAGQAGGLSAAVAPGGLRSNAV